MCLEAEQRADCTNQINLSFALKYVWEETKQINRNIQLKWQVQNALKNHKLGQTMLKEKSQNRSTYGY